MAKDRARRRGVSNISIDPSEPANYKTGANVRYALILMMLAAQKFSRARDFMLTQARPLERGLFRFHFGGAPAADARTALAFYQNNNGGFGRALEPDFRLPASSALATSVAFQVLRDLALPAEDPMVCAAVRWTQSAFDRTIGRWPATPRGVNDWPHAPWWTWQTPGEPGFTANPGAELVAHLWHYHAVANADFLADVTERTDRLIRNLRAKPPMHDLLCILRLLETPYVPATLRNRAAERVRRAGPAIVARKPRDWKSYGTKPIMLAPRGDSLLAPLLKERIAANLDFEIGRQGADGAWPPNWDWLDQYPEDWPQAERDWKGVLTLQTLLTLRSYGRLPSAAT